MYAFEIKAQQNVVETMKRIEKAMADMTAKVESSTKRAEQSIEHMGDTAKRVGAWIAEAFAVREVYEFGKELLHTTAEFQAFENVIKYSSRNAYDAGQNLDYVRDVVTRLHLPLREAFQGFSEMQAGLIGTGIEGEKVRKLFEGISTAATVLHLPAHNLEMVLYDFKEIGERGLNMRNMRSLMGWLPGISEIVKETFHKTFQELQKEGVSGPEFLDKLSEGLRKHFAPGLPNAGNSLQSAINDTTTALTKLKLEMGQNLEPLFIDIMNRIRETFDSGIFKTFVANIKPIAEMLITLTKLWIEYKIAVGAVALAKEGYIAVTKLVAIAQGAETVAIGETEVALGGMKAALIETGIGAFIVALGLVVEGFATMNSKIDESMNKLSHLKEITQGFETVATTFNRTNTAFGNLGGLTGTEKSELLSDLLREQKSITDELNTHANPLLAQARANAKGFTEPKQLQGESAVEYSGRLEAFWNNRNVLQQQVAEASKKTADLVAKGVTVQNQIAALQKLGIKSDKGAAVTLGGGITEGALKTVGLAGAQGGLGEAKIINIKIDTMQKVSVGTPRDLKSAGQDAVEVMLRTLQNIGNGQSRTQ